MKHHMTISVSKAVPPDGGIMDCRRITMRERILRFLFGEKKRLTIIVPGDSVDEVDIRQRGGGSRESTAST